MRGGVVIPVPRGDKRRGDIDIPPFALADGDLLFFLTFEEQIHYKVEINPVLGAATGTDEVLSQSSRMKRPTPTVEERALLLKMMESETNAMNALRARSATTATAVREANIDTEAKLVDAASTAGGSDPAHLSRAAVLLAERLRQRQEQVLAEHRAREAEEQRKAALLSSPATAAEQQYSPAPGLTKLQAVLRMQAAWRAHAERTRFVAAVEQQMAALEQQMRMQAAQRRRLHQRLSESEDEQSVIALRKVFPSLPPSVRPSVRV